MPAEDASQLEIEADSVDTKNIRSYVFAPPLYGTQGYFNGTFKAIPNVGRGRGLLLSRRGARRRGDGEHETIQPNGDRLEGRRHRGYLTVTCPNIQEWGVQK